VVHNGILGNNEEVLGGEDRRCVMSKPETSKKGWDELTDDVSAALAGAERPAANGDALTADAWDALVATSLDRWEKDPQQIEEEGLMPPSVEVLARARQVARTLRAGGGAPPLRIVPDGDGGVVFERRAGSVLETLAVEADGSAELASFDGGLLVTRKRST
jgi:hypothetical protein